MFQFFSIIIFFVSLLYGVWHLNGNTNQVPSSSNSSYEEYLKQALNRNTRLYSVSFYAEEFSEKNFISGNTQNPLNSKSSAKSITYKPQATENENSAAKGNFGTPKIGDSSGSSDCTGGLIYDPCLVIGDPIRASGDLRFGS